MRCKNIPRNGKAAYYTGEEPSPKGNGYCARYEKVGTRKRGTDGRTWQVKTVNGVKRWAPSTAAAKPRRARKAMRGGSGCTSCGCGSVPKV